MKRQLDKIFYPKSIAVIGASVKEHTVGYAILRNMLDSGYEGAIYPINLKYRTIQGVKSYRTIKSLPEVPDLAIIATPAATVASLVGECGQFGISGVYIISAGFKEAGPTGMAMYDSIKAVARKYRINIIGPNCLGFMNPAIHLNATFANKMAMPGNVAFISQSGALCTSILDWSLAQQFGFSHFVSIGSMLDIGFHDLIDYFGMDHNTSCIILYMESLSNARAFMSAARAFSRSKPIIVLKAGKSQEGARAALSHTGSLAGNDDAYAAAFRRAGIIRVDTVAQLFNMAQALAMQPTPKGNRLAIVTNAGGPGILATDYLMGHGGRLPDLKPTTLNHLNKVLPSSWSRKNPVDVLGDASPNQFAEAVHACLNDEATDGVLAILTPQAIADATEVAQELASLQRHTNKTVLACWMGEEEVQEGRNILEANSIPTYRFPESAVDVFLRMYSHKKHLELLYETPPNIPKRFVPNKSEAKKIIENAITKGQQALEEQQSKAVLAAYGIPVNTTFLAKNLTEAVQHALEIGFPVVLKIASPDIPHKTDVGGVVLNINSEEGVRNAYHSILEKAAKEAPQAALHGVLVEKMHRKRYELLIGMHQDEVFGPLIVFGMGGITVEVFQDHNTAIPPLNMSLAQQLIEETKVFQLLSGFRGRPAVDLEALKFELYKFSYLAVDFPSITSIDINPYVVDETGGIALDAQIQLRTAKPGDQRLVGAVISPYPNQYVKYITLKNGLAVTLRPIKPEDEPLEAELFEYLSKETIYFRFFGYVPAVTHEMLSRFTHIDYDREMAIVAEINNAGKMQLIGVVRIVGDPWSETAEYAIVVADQWHGLGLGTIMTDYIIDIAKDKGYQKIYATLLRRNTAMKRLFEKRGFTISGDELDTFRAELVLGE